MKKILSKIWIYFKPFTNWKFLVSFGLAWMITNGWAWLGLIFGNILKIEWMIAVCGGYMAFLWMPFTPEKIVTIPLAIFFQTLLFRKDKKVRKQLEGMKIEAKKDLEAVKFKFWCIKNIIRLRNSQFCMINFDKKQEYERTKHRKSKKI